MSLKYSVRSSRLRIVTADRMVPVDGRVVNGLAATAEAAAAAAAAVAIVLEAVVATAADTAAGGPWAEWPAAAAGDRLVEDAVAVAVPLDADEGPAAAAAAAATATVPEATLALLMVAGVVAGEDGPLVMPAP